MTGNVQLYLTDEGITRGGSYTGWGAHSGMGVLGQGYLIDSKVTYKALRTSGGDRKLDEETGDSVTYPRFISDAPAVDDSFQTHSAIAGAISNAIESNRELRIIGLLGRWGSGKSTVVKFVESNLVGKKRGHASYKFFTYDAWLHQSDPPRLAFIRNLIDYLESENLASPNQWEEDWKRLSGQLKLIDKVDTPILSYDAKWLFVSLIVFALGASLLKFDLVNGALSSPPNEIARATLALSIILVLAPIIAWIGRVVYVRYKKGKNLSWFPPFLINKSLERTATRIEESPGPNTIEFGKTFRKILLNLQELNVHLIVTIDNIDRVGAKNAFDIWSSVRSFFLGHNFENTSNAFRSFHPTVLLPVDDQAIQRVFETISQDSEASHSFVEKTFDATFVVSEPVTSDWRAYLEKQARWALGDQVTDRDIFWIGRFFETRHRTDSKQAPKRITPRVINNLINKIVSLALQWRNSDLSVVSFAYFSIFSEEVQANITEFVHSNPDILPRANPEWRNEIAALYFGVEKSIAAQILIEDPLVQSVHGEDLETFRNLASWPSFGTVFEKLTGGEIFYPEDVAEAFSFYRKASSLLIELGSEYDDLYWLNLSWDNLGKNLDLSAQGAEYSIENFGGIDKILNRIGKGYSQSLAAKFRSGVGHLLAERPDSLDVVLAGSLTGILAEFYSKRGLDFEPYQFDGPTSHILMILSSIADEPHLLEMCNFDFSRQNIATELVSLAANNETSDAASKILSVFRDTAFQQANDLAERDWSALRDFAAALISTPPGSSPFATESLRLLHFLASISKVEAPKVLSLMKQGHPANWLKKAINSNRHSELTAGIALAIWSNTPVPRPPEGSWNTLFLDEHLDEEAVVSALRELGDDVTIDLLAQHAENYADSKSLIRRIVSYQIDNRDIGPVYLDKILNNILFYLNAVPNKAEDRFLERIVNYNSFTKTLKSMDWSETLHNLSIDINRIQSDKNEEILQGLTDKLSTTVPTIIDDAIRRGEHPYPTIDELIVGHQVVYGASSNFTKALIEYGSVKPDTSKIALERFQKLISLLNGYSQRKVFGAISSAMLNSISTADSLRLAQFFGRRLLGDRSFLKHADISIERLVIQFMDLKNGRELLRENSTVVRGWLQAAGPDTRGRLAKKIHAMMSSRNSHRSEFAATVSATWKDSLA